MLIVFFLGFFSGGVVVVWFITQPREREVLEVALKKVLPRDSFVSVEWLYFHMELSPKDLPTLRHILELYDEEGVVVAQYNNETQTVEYKLAVNTLA